MKRYLIIVPLFFFSCQKDEPSPEPEWDPFGCPGFVAFEGLVVDSLTGEPLPGLQIWRPYGMPGYVGKISDSTGHYTAEIHYYKCPKPSSTYAPNEQPQSATLWLNVEEDYYAAEYVNLQGVPENSILYKDIRALPYGQLAIHFVGTTSGEELTTRIPNGYESRYFQLGTDVDTTVYCKVPPNRTSEISLRLNGVEYSVTPYLSGYGNSGTLEIHYP